jgi:RNA 2',3'-cyclic 3'-phosphodiesterase
MADRELFRLFIAVTLPEEVKAKIEAAQAELRQALPGSGVRWTRREQFHLTLKFLGDVDAARVEALKEAIRAACQGFSALQLRAERVGCFPDQHFPRVVWVGVQDRTDQLPRLQQAVEAATQHFTIEHKEERFTGHVTLARIKRITRPEAEALGKAAAGMAESSFGQWAAGRIELMRSVLSPQGASHSSLAAAALTKTAVD